MQAIARNVPLLLRAGMAGRPRLLIVALDQMVPPAAVLIVVALAAMLAMFSTGLLGPAWLLFAALGLLGLSLGAVWLRFGRRLVPVAMLGQTLRYFVWKLPLAFQFVTRRERQWLRTEREP